MTKVLALLEKYNVTEYELVTWVASALEHRIGGDNCTERMEQLSRDLNVLSCTFKKGASVNGKYNWHLPIR